MAYTYNIILDLFWIIFHLYNENISINILNKFIFSMLKVIFLFFILIFMFGSEDDCVFEDTQLGVSICSINVNGFSSEHEKGIDKRIKLNNWLKNNNIDICCGQEWYKFKKNEKNAYLSSKEFQPDYLLHYNNSKTFILYKNNIKFTPLHYQLKTNGIDITWGIIESKEFYLAIASIYHSPSYDASWDGIAMHIRDIKHIYKNKPVYFSINGDANARHHIWTDSIDDRGEHIVEFTDENGLNVCNINGMKTFQNMRSKKMDAIDLTIVSDELNQFIEEWDTNIDLHIIKTNESSKIGFSDHFCVIIKFNFNINLDNNIKYTWRFNPKKDIIYSELIKIKMEIWFKYYLKYKNDINMLDPLTELFEIYIREAAIEAYGIKVYNKNSKRILSKKERELIRKCRKVEKKYIKHIKYFGKQNRQTKEIKKQLNKNQKELRIERIKNLNEENSNRNERINNSAIDNTKEFYRLYNRASKVMTTKLGPLYDKIDGYIIATTNEEIANELLNHFNAPLKENIYNEKALKNIKK